MELVGTSIDEAKASEGKRKAQKKEGRVLEMLPESKMTFQELTDWFFGLAKYKEKPSTPIRKIYMKITRL